MKLIKWFLWRRYFFKKWTKGFEEEPFLSNATKVNLAGCRDNKLIYRDMVMILHANRPG